MCSRRSEHLQIQGALFLHLDPPFAWTAENHLSSSFFLYISILTLIFGFLAKHEKNLPTYAALLLRSSLRQELKVTQNAAVAISQPEVRDSRLS